MSGSTEYEENARRGCRMKMKGLFSYEGIGNEFIDTDTEGR